MTNVSASPNKSDLVGQGTREGSSNTSLRPGMCKVQVSQTVSLMGCFTAMQVNIRYGVVANIIASHAIARGSIPRVGSVLRCSVLNDSFSFDSSTRILAAYC